MYIPRESKKGLERRNRHAKVPQYYNYYYKTFLYILLCINLLDFRKENRPILFTSHGRIVFVKDFMCIKDRHSSR